jgi:hypothetical protein
MTERPSPGEQLAGIAGLALILTMFLFAWYGWPGSAASGLNGLDAFDAFSDWFAIILVFAGFGGIMLGLFGNGVARLPISLSVITTVLAGLGTIVLVIYVISPPDPPNFGASGGFVEGTLSREFGLFLGLVELIALTLGAYMTMQEEGVSFGSAADRLSGPGDGWQDRGTEQHPQQQPPPPPPAQDPYQQPPPPPQHQPPPAPPQDPYQQPPPPPPPPPPPGS